MLLISLGQGRGEAVHLRHHHIEQHQRESLVPAVERILQHGQRLPTLATPVGSTPQFGSTSRQRISRFVEHTSTTRTGRILESSRSRRIPRRLRPHAKLAVKGRHCHCQPALAQILPPNRETSCEVIARPSPVLQTGDAIELSAWVKASKIRFLLVGRDPDACIATATCRQTLPSFCARVNVRIPLLVR